MKKFILLMVVLFGFNAKALAAGEIIVNGSKSFGFDVHEEAGLSMYLLKLDDDANLSNGMRLNNLAYLGTLTSDYKEQITIQKMILDCAYPDYTFAISLDKELFNSSSIENKIEEKLKKWDKNIDLNNKEFDVKIYDDLVLESSKDLSLYHYMEHDHYNKGKKLGLVSFKEKGSKVITFDNYVHEFGPYIYALHETYRPFTIRVNVLGKTLKFNMLDNDTYEFLVYDFDEKKLDEIKINKDNNTYIYGGENIILKEKTKAVSDIKVFMNNYQDEVVDVGKNVKRYSVTIETVNMNKKVLSDISIYKDNYLVDECKDVQCVLKLSSGEYRIINNLTKEEKEVLVDSDRKIVFQIENEQNSSGAVVKANESVTEKEVIDAKIEEDIVDIPDTFVGGVNETVYFNTFSNYGSNYLSRLWGRKRSTL